MIPSESFFDGRLVLHGQGPLRHLRNLELQGMVYEWRENGKKGSNATSFPFGLFPESETPEDAGVSGIYVRSPVPSFRSGLEGGHTVFDLDDFRKRCPLIEGHRLFNITHLEKRPSRVLLHFKLDEAWTSPLNARDAVPFTKNMPSSPDMRKIESSFAGSSLASVDGDEKGSQVDEGFIGNAIESVSRSEGGEGFQRNDGSGYFTDGASILNDIVPSRNEDFPMHESGSPGSVAPRNLRATNIVLEYDLSARDLAEGGFFFQGENLEVSYIDENDLLLSFRAGTSRDFGYISENWLRDLMRKAAKKRKLPDLTPDIPPKGHQSAGGSRSAFNGASTGGSGHGNSANDDGQSIDQIRKNAMDSLLGAGKVNLGGSTDDMVAMTVKAIQKGFNSNADAQAGTDGKTDPSSVNGASASNAQPSKDATEANGFSSNPDSNASPKAEDAKESKADDEFLNIAPYVDHDFLFDDSSLNSPVVAGDIVAGMFHRQTGAGDLRRMSFVTLKNHDKLPFHSFHLVDHQGSPLSFFFVMEKTVNSNLAKEAGAKAESEGGKSNESTAADDGMILKGWLVDYAHGEDGSLVNDSGVRIEDLPPDWRERFSGLFDPAYSKGSRNPNRFNITNVVKRKQDLLFVERRIRIPKIELVDLPLPGKMEIFGLHKGHLVMRPLEDWKRANKTHAKGSLVAYNVKKGHPGPSFELDGAEDGEIWMARSFFLQSPASCGDIHAGGSLSPSKSKSNSKSLKSWTIADGKFKEVLELPLLAGKCEIVKMVSSSDMVYLWNSDGKDEGGLYVWDMKKDELALLRRLNPAPMPL